MSTQGLIPIDGEKLKIEILTRGLSFRQIDSELGFAGGYTSKTIRRGSATLGFIKMLDTLYGIPRLLYEPKPEEPEEQEEEPECPPKNEDGSNSPETHIIHDIINLSELKHVIYEAVYQAVLDAWQDDEPSIEQTADRGLINNVPYV